jgi:hypothetical protein
LRDHLVGLGNRQLHVDAVFEGRGDQHEDDQRDQQDVHQRRDVHGRVGLEAEGAALALVESHGRRGPYGRSSRT